jgi:hypothetical protein
MEAISQTFKFILFVIFYIPLNIVSVIGITFLFRFLDKVLNLHFPLWALCIASAIFVFVFLYAMLYYNNADDYEYYLWTTFFINIASVLFMLFSNYIFKDSASTAAFVFGKTQVIAMAIYTVLLIVIGLIPTFGAAADALTDMNNEKYKANVIEIIETNNVADFEKEIATHNFLEKFKIDDKAVFEYLVSQNKVELVDLVYQKKPENKDYYYVFDIKSPEMIDVLAKNGLTSSSILLPLIRANKNELAKYYVSKHKPVFDSSSDIVEKVLIEKNDMDMLSFLKENGMPLQK